MNIWDQFSICEFGDSELDFVEFAKWDLVVSIFRFLVSWSKVFMIVDYKHNTLRG